MRTTIAVWALICLVFACSAYIAAEAYDIWKHGFIECYQTTTFNGDEFLCIPKNRGTIL